MSYLPESFDLLETLLLDAGSYHLLDRHVQRLLASAHVFRFRVSGDTITAALDAYAQPLAQGRWRVRLRVTAEGRVLLEHQPLQPLPPHPLAVALAHAPVNSDDCFLAHKTTHRAVYNAHRAEHPGLFDVLLWNERGELTEFTTGNLVVELGAERVTPARSSGLLPGTLRADLLERGVIHEATLTPSVLPQASRLWFINSVRGLVEVRLIAAMCERNEDDHY